MISIRRRQIIAALMKEREECLRQIDAINLALKAWDAADENEEEAA